MILAASSAGRFGAVPVLAAAAAAAAAVPAEVTFFFVAVPEPGPSSVSMICNIFPELFSQQCRLGTLLYIDLIPKIVLTKNPRVRVIINGDINKDFYKALFLTSWPVGQPSKK
jgi:hypothetical protein